MSKFSGSIVLLFLILCTASGVIARPELLDRIVAVIDDDSVVDLRNRTQKLIDASGGVL